MRSSKPFRVVLAVLALSVVACGPKSKRDASTPAREVTYNDDCGLQDYFDQRRAAGLKPLSASDETVASSEKGITVGQGSYRLGDPLARRRFARLLREEYSGIDAKVLRAVEKADGDVFVRVHWWDAGQIRRLRPGEDVVVETPDGAIELPPNSCVTDLLFGDTVYAMRAKYLKNEVELATGKISGEPLPAGTNGP